MASNYGMVEELWIRKEGVFAKPSYYPGICREENPQKFRIASFPVKIRTKDLPNTKIERYRYTNPLYGCIIPLSVSGFLHTSS